MTQQTPGILADAFAAWAKREGILPRVTEDQGRDLAAAFMAGAGLRAPGYQEVTGYCPMGCGRTLFLADGGYVTCSYIHCPRPDAVADLLGDKETGHIVSFGDDGFTVRHPLRERLDDALMACTLHEHLAGLDGPPVTPGRYRVHGEPGILRWEGLS